MLSDPSFVSSAPGSAAGRDALVTAARARPGSSCTCACAASRSREDTNAGSVSLRGTAAPRSTLVSMPARGHWLTRRADANDAHEVSLVPVTPTSVTSVRLPTTFARIAVPALLCASREPTGISTCGVTDRRGFGLKLTAAAASAGEPGVVADTPPICPNDRLTGVAPVVVSVNPRKGDVNAEPDRGPALKTA